MTQEVPSMTDARWLRSSVLLPVALLLAAGCGNSSTPANNGSGKGGVVTSCSGGEDTSSCSVILAAGSDDTTAVQTELINSKSGDTVCFCPGSYSFKKELSLTTNDVTVKGVGTKNTDVVLDFDKQTEGKDAFSVTGDGFKVENLSLKNSHGDGIVVTGATGVTFRNIKVSWDAGSVTKNGAYAIYPVQSTNVLVEDSEVVGAADAGLYVGQCTNAIVRNNKVHGNVAGIEFENTTNGEAYGNESWDNTAGILVFALPNLDKKDSMKSNVHDNNVHDNNRENFAEQGSIVSNVPTGTGMLVLAADEVEIHNNTLTNNDSTGVLMLSFDTVALLMTPKPQPDPQTSPYSHSIYIHDNTFTGNGGAPRSLLGLWKIKPLEDVIWDGIEEPGQSIGLCLGTTDVPSFRDFHAPDGISDPSKHTTDSTAYQCKGTVLSPVQL